MVPGKTANPAQIRPKYKQRNKTTRFRGLWEPVSLTGPPSLANARRGAGFSVTVGDAPPRVPPSLAVGKPIAAGHARLAPSTIGRTLSWTCQTAALKNPPPAGVIEMPGRAGARPLRAATIQKAPPPVIAGRTRNPPALAPRRALWYIPPKHHIFKEVQP